MKIKKKIKYFLVILLLFVSIIVLALFYVTKPKQINLRDLVNIEDLSGNEIDIISFAKGKPIIINYWGTFCKPCIEEFEYFNELQNKYGDSINFIMISDEEITKVKTFIEKNNYNFTFLLSKKKLSFYKIYALPTTYFYNKESEQINSVIGSMEKEDIKNNIKNIL